MEKAIPAVRIQGSVDPDVAPADRFQQPAPAKTNSVTARQRTSDGLLMAIVQEQSGICQQSPSQLDGNAMRPPGALFDHFVYAHQSGKALIAGRMRDRSDRDFIRQTLPDLFLPTLAVLAPRSARAAT